MKDGSGGAGKNTGFPDMACLWLSVSAEWPSLIQRRIIDLANKRRQPQNKILNVSNLPRLLHYRPSKAAFLPRFPPISSSHAKPIKRRPLFLRSLFLSVHAQKKKKTPQQSTFHLFSCLSSRGHHFEADKLVFKDRRREPAYGKALGAANR